MTRIIRGLRWARRLEDRPQCIPIGRPRGVKADGVRYEKRLAAELSWATHGQWWQFEDASGIGYCQTDLMIERKEWTLILEAKLSWTAEAYEQLEGLYKPVLEMALRKPCWGLQVCLRLRKETPMGSISGSLPGALALARAGQRATFHWMGKSAIVGIELPAIASRPRLTSAARTHIDMAAKAGL